MQFQLPSSLQSELLAYDPKLKLLQQKQTSKATKAKPKFPLGAVFDLIPVDIISAAIQEQVVTDINTTPVQNRYRRFTYQVDENTTTETIVTHAIIYHYEKVWYAAWLPPKGHEDDYVYGYAYAYRDTPSTIKSLSYDLISNKSNADVTYAKYGRSEFCVVRKSVTKQDIIDGYTKHWWSPAYISYGKGQYIKEAINDFERALKNTIPKWTDQRGFFDRITHSNWTAILDLKGYARYWEQFDNPDQAMLDLVPSADLVYALGETYEHENRSLYNEGIHCIAKRNMHIIGKPFFRKWIQAQCDEAIAMLNDPSNDLFCKVKQPWGRIQHLIESIDYINNIWPDCPIDFYQSHLEELLGLYIDRYITTQAITWLRTNMQPSSFFNIINKYYADSLRERGSYANKETGVVTYFISEWHDTMSMLEDVLDKNIPIKAPKRWRLTEFHDHVQVEAWKIKHPNVDLPQDLFPTPVKVEVGDERWSFFQPHDTHQLSAWGQAVRNCVGNAKDYAEGVRKKKHFIVLCMVDGKPQFTVQLKVDMGMMTVSQIVGMSNQRLTEEQKDAYTQAFGKALHSRNDELKSA